MIWLRWRLFQAVKMNRRIVDLVLVLSLSFLLFGCQKTVINDNLEGIAGEHVGTLNGYEFYRERYTCFAVVGNITIDKYNFGYFGSACGNTLNDIGYEIKKGDETFRLQDLVDDGELRTRDIYYKIYKPDPFKKGEL